MAAPLNPPTSPPTPPLLLRARLVLPLSRPAIRDGAVLVSRKRITALGSWRDLSRRSGLETVDLGDALLMPGLVNAHCHLDYTDMAGQLPPPKVFADWLKSITAAKASWSYSDYAQSWLRGAQMLLRSGTTTVADIEAMPQLLPEVLGATPLRVFSFLEIIGLKPQRPPGAILQEAVDLVDRLLATGQLASLSPHAPYTASPELLRLSAQTARRRQWRMTIHVAESEHEFEMFHRARGVMFDWLQRSGREMSDCGLGSPVQHLERCGALGENLLAIHVNYLRKNDAALLARRQVHVVHCPRSHFYFRHQPFPFRRLANAGINLCLGTDSLASVYKTRRQTVELNLFDEMRALAETQPSLSARKLVHLVTLNAARALGLQGQIGELSKGAFADLIALPFAGRPAEVYQAILNHRGDVSATRNSASAWRCFVSKACFASCAALTLRSPRAWCWAARHSSIFPPTITSGWQTSRRSKRLPPRRSSATAPAPAPRAWFVVPSRRITSWTRPSPTSKAPPLRWVSPPATPPPSAASAPC
jgi:cytosine/adenosine deaminase-related metal-dependent hydrolase